MAIGLGLVLLEGALVELVEAEGADEVFGMEALPHGRHTATADRLPATRAETSASAVVVSLAVRSSAVLEERSALEARLALLQYHSLGY